MPHLEIKHTQDLKIDFKALFSAVESLIHSHDSHAGVCKSRAQMIEKYQHSHVAIEVSLLEKPHRDQAFTEALMKDLEATIKKHLLYACHFSLEVKYNSKHYATSIHQP